MQKNKADSTIYSNSPLVEFSKISPNYSNRPAGQRIDTITPHCIAGDLTIESAGALFNKKSTNASSNYVIGSDGRIGLIVPEQYRSWCSSSRENDNRAVTIEIANCGGSDLGWPITKLAMNALIELCADICIRNNIHKLVWSTDKNKRIKHLDGCNVTVHRDYANKACPGDYIYSRLGFIAEQVNNKIEKIRKQEEQLIMEMTKDQLREFIEETVRAMGKNKPADKWAEDYINQAKSLKVSDGSNPQSYATRQEVIAMLMREHGDN